MGFTEGFGTAIIIVVNYLLFRDVSYAIIAGIIGVAFFMKGDND